MYKHVLVAVDLSDESEFLLKKAVGIAKRNDVNLAEHAGYPIKEKLSGSGDLGQVLTDAIDQYDVDLLVTGHHQDFWSKLMSSTRQVMNTIKIDMLVVPLRDE